MLQSDWYYKYEIVWALCVILNVCYYGFPYRTTKPILIKFGTKLAYALDFVFHHLAGETVGAPLVCYKANDCYFSHSFTTTPYIDSTQKALNIFTSASHNLASSMHCAAEINEITWNMRSCGRRRAANGIGMSVDDNRHVSLDEDTKYSTFELSIK